MNLTLPSLSELPTPLPNRLPIPQILELLSFRPSNAVNPSDFTLADPTDLKAFQKPYGADRRWGIVTTVGKVVLSFVFVAIGVNAIAFGLFPPGIPLGVLRRIAFVITGLLSALFPAGIASSSDVLSRHNSDSSNNKYNAFVCLSTLKTASLKQAVDELLTKDSWGDTANLHANKCTFTSDGLLADMWRFGLVDKELLKKVMAARILAERLLWQIRFAETAQKQPHNTNLASYIPLIPPDLKAYKERVYQQIRNALIISLPATQAERNRLFHPWFLGNIFN